MGGTMLAHPCLPGVGLLGSGLAERGRGAPKLTSCTGFKLEPLGAEQVDVLVIKLEKRALYYMYYRHFMFRNSYRHMERWAENTWSLVGVMRKVMRFPSVFGLILPAWYGLKVASMSLSCRSKARVDTKAEAESIVRSGPGGQGTEVGLRCGLSQA